MDYKIERSKDGYVAYIYDDDGNVIIEQPFNPNTGDPFRTEEEARAFVREELESLYPNRTKIKVTTLDLSNQESWAFKVGEEFLVHIEVVDLIDGTRLPLSGSYFVPLVNKISGGMALLFQVDIKGGLGEKRIKIDRSGVYRPDIHRMMDVSGNEVSTDALVECRDILITEG